MANGVDVRVIGGHGKARRIQEAGAGSGRAQVRSDEINQKRLESGEAWEDFCGSLLEAGRLILDAEQPDLPGLRAEGFRYLLGLVKVGVAQAGELSDRDRPKWLRFQDSFSKWGAENADNHYLVTHIRSDATYRITGTRGSCFTFLIEVGEGFMQLGDTANFATMTADQIEVDADGRFEIIASRERQPGNWLPLDENARQIVIRQYFKDWENEIPASFQIDRVEDVGEPPAPLRSAEMARILDDAANWVRTSTEFWGTWIPALRAQYMPGEMVPAVRYVGGADDIRYGNDYYRLDEGDAMIVELTPPNAQYWAIQLCDLWFVTTDYVNRLTSLNDAQLLLDADGKCRVVIAHEDPGVPNWLDTAGATEGCLQYRYIWTQDNPLPSVRVVPFAELRDALPAETPTVTPESRRRTIRARGRAVARREQVG